MEKKEAKKLTPMQIRLRKRLLILTYVFAALLGLHGTDQYTKKRIARLQNELTNNMRLSEEVLAEAQALEAELFKLTGSNPRLEFSQKEADKLLKANPQLKKKVEEFEALEKEAKKRTNYDSRKANLSKRSKQAQLEEGDIISSLNRTNLNRKRTYAIGALAGASIAGIPHGIAAIRRRRGKR